MRKIRALVIIGVGAWLGWRLRERLGALDNYRGVGPTSRADAGTTALADRLRPADAVEKARAIVELGRERGKDLVRQLLGGRAA